MGRGFLLTAVVGASLAAPPVAEAASVSGDVVDFCSDVVCAKYMQGSPRTTYRFATGEGERSTVTVSRSGAVLRFHDDSATVEAGARCQQVDVRTVACDTAASPAPLGVAVVGGAGDDVLSLATPLGLDTTLSGGPGADDLRGGPAGDTLLGGPGDDRLSGGDGSDTLRGDDPGAAPPGRDVIDGGGGVDLVSYSERSSGVDVDLQRPGPSNGAPGEGDAVAGVERLEGGAGDDRLAGDDGPDLLLGLGGDDTLAARSGDDVLVGGRGRDTLAGGPGDDELATSDEQVDDLRCGAGDDVVADAVATGEYEDEEVSVGPDAADVVHRDCERAVVADDSGDGRDLGVAIGGVRLRRGRTLVVPNPCRAERRCRTTVTVRPRAGARAVVSSSSTNTRAATLGTLLTGPVRSAAGRGRVAVTLRITKGRSRWTTRFTAALR